MLLISLAPPILKANFTQLESALTLHGVAYTRDPDAQRNGNGHSTESYIGSSLFWSQKAITLSKKGSPDHRTFQAVKKSEGMCTFLLHGNSDAPKGCPSQNAGYGIIEYDPTNKDHVALVGKHGNFREMFAAHASFPSWDAFCKAQVGITSGWQHNPHTKPARGIPHNGSTPKEHRMIILHKENSKFDEENGPGMFDGGDAEAQYRRDLRKRNADKRKRENDSSSEDSESESESESESDSEASAMTLRTETRSPPTPSSDSSDGSDSDYSP